MNNKKFILYTRNFIFGSEDSLVSTVGLLAGVASAGVGREEIIISGIVLICVEAFSMSVGSFLSERTTEESSPDYKNKESNSLAASIIMLVSYFFCGLIPLFPYFITTVDKAFWWSIVSSIAALLVLGIVSAKILKTHILKSALRMTIIGGIAISLGVTVGMLMR
ncbi:MAG: VIT1/CCC1 transporter family protein [Candidatus Pacebacteria bacterium]|nr:VIT1/CCC1 transporter family protein [Candidatus Paceibacterota bacterium]